MDFYLKKNLGLRMNMAQAMQMASEQAELGLEQTTPNPSVGCVILDSADALIGMGYHKQFGGPHAEVEAFQSVYNQYEDVVLTKGPFSVFVTLEPCAHEGKTPSCAKMLAAHPLAKVIYLMKDPHEKVAGQGHQILEDVGIKTYCVEDVLNGKAKNLSDETVKLILKYKSEFKKIIKKQKNLNRQFLYAMTSEMPYITLKWAQTLDCSLGYKFEDSTSAEESKDDLVYFENKRLMITNQEVQKEVHHLRACHDVVLVGRNTVFQDNPMLTNRFGSSKNKENKIVILDQNLDVLKEKQTLKLFDVHPKENIIFLTSNTADTSIYEREGYRFIKVENQADHLDYSQVFKQLKTELKINSVFVEGGVKVHSELLKQNLFNELYVFLAPKVLLKKTTLRLNPLLWFKAAVTHVWGLKFRIFEDNLLLNIKK